MQHARNYATLLNTGIGTKEMVHRIFKDIIPRTNQKNIKLNLLKWYTTLFAVRHLFDRDTNKCFSSRNNALTNLPYHLKWLMNDWFIIEKPFDLKEDISDSLIKIFIEFLINNLILTIFYFFTRWVYFEYSLKEAYTKKICWRKRVERFWLS